jgi:hypothetical protein
LLRKPEEKRLLGNVGIDDRVISKKDLKRNRMRGRGLD